MTAAEPTRVLIVEEERIIVLDLCAELEDLGYRVVGTAATSDEALAKAAEGKPDIALLDIRIKGAVDGIQTAALLRKQQDLAVVYLSANADENTMKRAMQTAPEGYLVKPYNPRSLHSTIQVALNHRARQREVDDERRRSQQQRASLIDLIQRIRTEANTDSLTQLPNRRYLDELLPAQLRYSERENQALGVMMLDVDHFKMLNDTRGHLQGDKALRALAAYLREHLREQDVACRYGGEEFAIIVPGASLSDTAMLAERLRAGIEKLVIETESTQLAITASIGVSAFPEHGMESEPLLQAADSALYRAKLAGRNRVVAASI